MQGQRFLNQPIAGEESGNCREGRGDLRLLSLSDFHLHLHFFCLWKQTGPCQPSPRSQSLMVFSSIRPLWAKGLVPWVIVIYASSPSGCKMVLIRCMPCLLSLARGRLGARLVHHEREGDLHGSQQHVFNLWGIYWPSIRLLSTVYTVPNSSKTNGRLNFFFH